MKPAKSIPYADLAELPDSKIAELQVADPEATEQAVLAHLDTEALGFAHLRDGRWGRVFRRAHAILTRTADRKGRYTQGSRIGTAWERIRCAALVADYFCWKWADEDTQADEKYPAKHLFLASWNVSAFQLSDALTRTKARAWEHKYVDDETDESRLVTLKRAAMRNVQDLKGVDIQNRNPAHLRVAAELLGKAAPGVSIHHGNVNTVNILTPKDDFDVRMKRLLEVAQTLSKEVPRDPEAVCLPEHPQALPRGNDQGDAEDGAPPAG